MLKKIHTENLHILMVEVYKCLNDISPPFTWDYFNQKTNPYNLKKYSTKPVQNKNVCVKHDTI